MKDFSIRMPSRLTECNVAIYTMPYYSGITVIGDLVINSNVDGFEGRKNLYAYSKLIIDSKVDETFKLVHERADFRSVLMTRADFDAYYALCLEPPGMILMENPARLSGTGFLRAGSGIVLGLEPIMLQISRPLGGVASDFIITSSVEKVVKLGFFGNDTQAWILSQNKAEFVKVVSALPEKHGIIVSSAPWLGTLQKMTGAAGGIIVHTDGSAVIAHHFGEISDRILLKSGIEALSKTSRIGINDNIAVCLDDLVTKRTNILTNLKDEMILLSELRNLLYMIPGECEDSSFVIAIEGAGIPRKVLYGVDAGVLLESEADGSSVKWIETGSTFSVESDAGMTKINLALPEETDTVITADAVEGDLKRYRLLAEMDDSALEDLDDMTLEELDWVWLT